MQFNTRIDAIADPRLEAYGVTLHVKRDDLIHPYVSGNKLYKLSYHVQEALAQGHNTLLTFGGAWSNHLVATAAYCKENGLQCIGVVRGDELEKETLNPSLQFCADQGMRLLFVSREEYRRKEESYFISRLNSLFGGFYLVPEGGAGTLGAKGASHIIDGIEGYDIITCACGTGTTLAGIASALPPHTKALGFSVLKGEDGLSQIVEQYVGHRNNWEVITGYHCGGYGKTTEALLAFKSGFELQNGIPLDKVYTAKLFYGLYDMISKGLIGPNVKILAIHTGGYRFS